MTFLFDPPSAPEFHLSKDFLILMNFEELSPGQSSLCRQHLDECPTCQAMFDRIARTTAGITARRERIVNQIGPPPPAERDRFIRELDNLLGPAFGRRWWNPLQLQWGIQIITKNAPLLSASLIAICAYVILFSVSHGRRPDVSAAEFLNRAVASDERTPRSAGPGAIQRKFLFKTAM